MTNTATEGVLYGIGNNLAVSGTSSPVAVNTGAALVYGFYYTNDASVNVTISTPATSTRVDVIVLRVSWAAQTVRITRVAGTEGAGVPSITQVANTTWDIPLANVSITTGGVITVTDRRTYVKHPGVYGWLNAALTVNDNLTVTKSNSGSYNEIAVSNTSNTAGSYARFNAAVGGASADDPLMTWSITGATTWAAGLDNSDGDKFKIAPYSVIGSGDVLTLDSSGNLTIPGALSANSLNASQLGSGTVPLARLSGISTSQLAADSVDDTIAGNRVPALTRRQGGSATDWSTFGTTTYTPGAVRIQTGVIETSGTGLVTVTFPVAFSAKPIVICSVLENLASVFATAYNESTTQVTLFAYNANPAGAYTLGANVAWIAIGPE